MDTDTVPPVVGHLYRCRHGGVWPVFHDADQCMDAGWNCYLARADFAPSGKRDCVDAERPDNNSNWDLVADFGPTLWAAEPLTMTDADVGRWFETRWGKVIRCKTFSDRSRPGEYAITIDSYCGSQYHIDARRKELKRRLPPEEVEARGLESEGNPGDSSPEPAVAAAAPSGPPPGPTHALDYLLPEGFPGPSEVFERLRAPEPKVFEPCPCCRGTMIVTRTFENGQTVSCSCPECVDILEEPTGRQEVLERLEIAGAMGGDEEE